MRQHDVAGCIEHFLGRMGALGVSHAIDDTRRNLAAAAHLQRTVAYVDVRGGKSQHLPLVLVLYLEVGDLLDDVRI